MEANLFLAIKLQPNLIIRSILQVASISRNKLRLRLVQNSIKTRHQRYRVQVDIPANFVLHKYSTPGCILITSHKALCHPATKFKYISTKGFIRNFMVSDFYTHCRWPCTHQPRSCLNLNELCIEHVQKTSYLP